MANTNPMKPTLSGVANNGSAYDLYGAADAPVVILIHGLGLCRHLWADYLAALSEKYRVLNYDLYGHGDSLPSSEKATLTVYSEQLADLMDQLQISHAVIIGFSIGGMINRRFAIDHPDRVAALVIMNSPHDRGSKAQQLVEERAASAAKQGVLSTMQSALERWFTAEFQFSHPQVLQQVVDWRSLADPTSYAQAAWVLAVGVTELCHVRIPVDSPTLVLSCENDTGSTPVMSLGIAAQINHADVQIVPKLKHLGLLENPELLTKILLDFLAKIKLSQNNNQVASSG